VCARYFRKIGQRWYLRGEAAGGNGHEGLLIAEEATIRDELTAIAWLRHMVSHPKLANSNRFGCARPACYQLKSLSHWS
jgi:hypothetical protein